MLTSTQSMLKLDFIVNRKNKMNKETFLNILALIICLPLLPLFLMGFCLLMIMKFLENQFNRFDLLVGRRLKKWLSKI